MEKFNSFIKNTFIGVVSALVVFAAVGAVMAVLNAVTWEVFGDWLFKGAIVAAIVFVGAGLVGLLVSVTGKQSSK